MEIIVLIAICIGLKKAWPYLRPPRCHHGVPHPPGAGIRCQECAQEDREQEAERKRIYRKQERLAAKEEAEKKRKLDRLRRDEAENVRQLTYLESMDPILFERVVSQAYRNLGWDVEDTPASGDRGVDAYLRRAGKTTVLQCKRLTSSRVGTPILRELLGTIVAEDADQGVLVTTSSFSEGAITWARASGRIELVDGHALVAFIAKAYPLGSPVPEDFVTRRKHPKVAPRRCPRCGSKTRRRKGKYGAFYGCMSYPSCTWTIPARNNP